MIGEFLYDYHSWISKYIFCYLTLPLLLNIIARFALYMDWVMIGSPFSRDQVSTLGVESEYCKCEVVETIKKFNRDCHEVRWLEGPKEGHTDLLVNRKVLLGYNHNGKIYPCIDYRVAAPYTCGREEIRRQGILTYADCKDDKTKMFVKWDNTLLQDKSDWNEASENKETYEKRYYDIVDKSKITCKISKFESTHTLEARGKDKYGKPVYYYKDGEKKDQSFPNDRWPEYRIRTGLKAEVDRKLEQNELTRVELEINGRKATAFKSINILLGDDHPDEKTQTGKPSSLQRLVAFGGNGEMAHSAMRWQCRVFPGMSSEVYSIDHRGYSWPETGYAYNNGVPNEKNLTEDAVAVIKQAYKDNGEEKVPVLGFSLGCAIAVAAAYEVPDMVDRILLFNPFTNLPDMATGIFEGPCGGALKPVGWLVSFSRMIFPGRFFLTEHTWNTLQRIQSETLWDVPIQVFSNTDDKVIPARLHNQVQAAAHKTNPQNAKEPVRKDGDHIDTTNFTTEEIRKFMEKKFSRDVASVAAHGFRRPIHKIMS